ncbi:hypothetical protein L208DRAFT_1386101 [Tricholoma matsutake]|nr:hypothetical protein L208DRAFT_1386101 [Tricholoma matsutake 945]
MSLSRLRAACKRFHQLLHVRRIDLSVPLLTHHLGRLSIIPVPSHQSAVKPILTTVSIPNMQA